MLIDKSKLFEQYKNPFNPYHLGLRFGLERLLHFLLEKNQQGKEIHIIFEKRGKKEDEALELEFRRICEGNKQFGIQPMIFKTRFPSKLFLQIKKQFLWITNCRSNCTANWFKLFTT